MNPQAQGAPIAELNSKTNYLAITEMSPNGALIYHLAQGSCVTFLTAVGHDCGDMEDEELLLRARKRAEAKINFYSDLALYLIVNVLLFALWWNGGGGFPWFLFVVFFWGLGVISHGLVLFRQSGCFDKNGGG